MERLECLPLLHLSSRKNIPASCFQHAAWELHSSAPSPSVQITLPQGRIQLILMSKNAAGNHKIKRLDMSKTAICNEVTHAINIDELDHIFDTDKIIK